MWYCGYSEIRPRAETESPKGRFTLYVTFPFRRGTSPFSKIFSCVIKWRCSHWQEHLRHVSVPFRRRCWENVWRDGAGPDLSVPARFRQSEQSYVCYTTLRVFACNEFCLFLSSEMNEKLIELVRKYEELYDMSNKKYSDSVWKEKSWGQTGEELKKIT